MASDHTSLEARLWYVTRLTMGRRGDYFPATNEFLSYASGDVAQSAGTRELLRSIIIADALVGAGMIGAFLALDERAWPIVGVLLLVLSAFTVFTGVRHKRRVATAPRANRENLRDLRQATEQRRLHKRVDGVAGAFLERAAGDWLRIRRALESPFFALEPVPQHWKEMRDRIERESNEAMMRLVSYVADCEGKCKDYDRWYSRAEEVVTVAQQELAGQIKSLLAEYQVKRNSRLRRSVPHLATIAWELRKLANEVETLPLKDVVSPTLDKPVPTSFDHLLTSIEELKKAEKELDQNQQVGS